MYMILRLRDPPYYYQVFFSRPVSLTFYIIKRILMLRDPYTQGSDTVHSAFLFMFYSYVHGCIHKGFLCPQILIFWGSDIQEFLCPVVLTSMGVLTIMGSYIQGFLIQGFLCSGVPISRGSQVQRFKGSCYIQGSYIQVSVTV